MEIHQNTENSGLFLIEVEIVYSALSIYPKMNIDTYYNWRLINIDLNVKGNFIVQKQPLECVDPVSKKKPKKYALATEK